MSVPYTYGTWRSQNSLQNNWAQIQPTQGSYVGNGTMADYSNMVLTWTQFDADCAAALSMGVSICYQIWQTPSWACVAADQLAPTFTFPGPSPAAGAYNSNQIPGPDSYAGAVGGSAVPHVWQYVTDITTQICNRAIRNGFSPSTFFIEVLNEPEFLSAANMQTYITAGSNPFWLGTVGQAVDYCASVYAAAKAVNANFKVLCPSQYFLSRLQSFVSAQGPSTGKYGYQVCDWLTIHPYTAAPNQPMGGGDLWNMSGTNVGFNAVNTMMTGLGYAKKPIAVTEWGINTSSSSGDVTTFNALPLATQQTYLSRLFAMAALEGCPLFIPFNTANLAGPNWTAGTAGALACTDVFTKLAGQTILPPPASGYVPWTGVVQVTLANGMVYTW